MVLNTYDSIYPTEADAEILGCGTLICLMIVTPMILLAYAVEGRKNIQATSLDAIFSFVGAAMLIAVGGNYLITNRKKLLYGYILGVLMHTNTWDQQ